MINDLSSEFCNILLDIIKKKVKKEKVLHNDSLYILINELAKKGNDEIEQLNCCKYFTDKISKEENLNNLENNLFLKEVTNYFSKNKRFYTQIIDQFEKTLKDNLKENDKEENNLKNNKKNILVSLYSFRKILKENLKIFDTENKKESIINKDIIKLFKDNFSKYKIIESEILSKLKKNEKREKKEKKEKELSKELDEHKNNMKIFIDFLMDIIHNLFPEVDYFDLLKEISLDNPIEESDKQIFYDYIKFFIENEKDNNYRIKKELKLFDILKNEKKDNMTIEQIDIFITIFRDINGIEENIKIKTEKIHGKDELWNAFFDMNSKDLSKKLQLFIYDLYEKNIENEILLDKCLKEINLIKDNENVPNNDNKLEKNIIMIDYIISKSEKDKFIYIKSHSDLLKEYIINIPLLLNKYNSSNNSEESENEITNYFYGNTNLNELIKLIHEKYDKSATDIKINILSKKDNKEELKQLNSDSDNLSLNILKNEFNFETIIFSGKIIKSLPFEINNAINEEFKSMLNEWFLYFSKGKNKMNYEDLINYLNKMDKLKEGNNYDDNIIITKEDFIAFYEKLSKDEPNIIYNNMKKMNYWKNFKKMKEYKKDEIKEIKSLKRYILGNNKKLYNSLIKIFDKSKKKDHIFTFLNSLYTNIDIYNELLENFNKNIEKEKYCLEYWYEITIILSFLQDLENSQLEKDVMSQKYLPFDDEKNINKKKAFLADFIKNGNNYIEKMINVLNKNLEENDGSEENYLFLDDLLIKIMKIISFMQNIFGQKIFYERNNNPNSTYYLNSHDKINKNKILDKEIEITNEEINNLNKIILNVFKFFFRNKSLFSEKTYIHIFNIVLNMKYLKKERKKEEIKEEKKEEPEINENNEIEEYDNDDYNYNEDIEEEEDIKVENIVDNIIEGEKDNDIDIFDLLSKNISNVSNRFMIKLEKYFNNLKQFTIEYNKNNNEKGSPIIYDISLEIINKELNKIEENDLDLDQIDQLMDFLNFFGQLLDFFNINIDQTLLERIIGNIETYLAGNAFFIEKVFNGLLGLLTKVVAIDKKEIMNIYNERIFNIYERIKKIILEENVINKVITKLQEIKNNNNKMLTSNDINNCFNYINNKTEGETILDPTFLIYKDFIINFSDNSTLVEIIKKLLENIENFNDKKGKEGKREIKTYMGLKKNYDYFYVNAIMQQLFYIPVFRDIILSLDADLITEHQLMFKELQKMFAYMKYSNNLLYDTNDFCKCFENYINDNEKKEGQIFFEIFFEQIENCLNNTKYKYFLDDYFKITVSTTYMCEECGETEDKFAKYNNIKLNIKGFKQLNNALRAMFNETKITSFCKKCHSNQEKKKKISISQLPHIFIIHLDRIHDNYEYGNKFVEKINDRLEFDFSLDLRENNICCGYDSISEYREITNIIYKREEEYYQYDIKGIVTYFGDAKIGEYISLIKKDNKWIRFNDVFSADNKDDVFTPIEDEGTVQYLSFGDDTPEIQNGYFLIYERKKKYPIKILDTNFKEENKEYNNFRIEFTSNRRDEVNKNFDITRIDKENIIANEKNIINYIFFDQELNETYSKIYTKDLKTQFPKDLFVQIMEENNKFFRDKEMDEYKQCEFKFTLIILEAISAKDFYLFNNKDFSDDDIKHLLNFFNQEIFENKLNEAITFSLKLGKKLDYKHYIDIFLDRLISPILNSEEKSEKIFELTAIIGKIFLSKNNFEKILKFDSNEKIFDNETIKKFLNIILQIIDNLLDKNQDLDFKAFFISFFDLTVKYTEKSLTDFDNEKILENLFCFYGILYEIVKLDKELFELPIKELLIILDKIKYYERREVSNIIYEIILFLIEDNKKYSKLKGIGNILNENLLHTIFNENSELLSQIILRMNYKEEKSDFTRLIIPSLFNYALKNNKLKKLLDLLFQIINIKDEYSLDRLYLIMGFPQFIIEKQDMNVIIEKQSDEKIIDVNKNIDELSLNGEEEEEEDSYNPDLFWPKFGIQYTEKYKTEEMFKYISNIKIYESHCILAQLFPCSNDYLYDNYIFIKDEDKLSEEERNEYIYELIKLALLEEGNYGLFKYIYLTQSRYIIKYNNLYEEIIDILSQEKYKDKYNLTKIKSNAEICIKKINYEMNKAFGKKNTTKCPDLPGKMKEANKKNKLIEEFTGFIPKYIPDRISKVLYSSLTKGDYYNVICLKYYTSYKDIETLRKEKNDNNKLLNEEEEQIEDEDDYIDADYLKYDIGENDLEEEDEHNFLLNYYEISQNKNNDKIELKDKRFPSNKSAKLSLMRFIFLYNRDNDILFRGIIEDSKKNKNNVQNYYISEYENIGYSKGKSYGEIASVYCRDYELNFLNEHRTQFNQHIINKNKISFPSESFFSESK